jgi:hypothetical protein
MGAAAMTRFSSGLATASLVLVVSVFAAPGQAQPMGAEALGKARSHCFASVAKVVGLPVSRLTVIKQTHEVSGVTFDVNVPKATAPWACLTDRQGKVKDVYFKGSEGAL